MIHMSICCLYGLLFRAPLTTSLQPYILYRHSSQRFARQVPDLATRPGPSTPPMPPPDPHPDPDPSLQHVKLEHYADSGQGEDEWTEEEWRAWENWDGYLEVKEEVEEITEEEEMQHEPHEEPEEEEEWVMQERAYKRPKSTPMAKPPKTTPRDDGDGYEGYVDKNWVDSPWQWSSKNWSGWGWKDYSKSWGHNEWSHSGASGSTQSPRQRQKAPWAYSSKGERR